MGYRETFFENTPSNRGRYQCVKCKKWFAKSNIDVDHRIPKRQGGTDDLWNLQAMCKHCNRSKGANNSKAEAIQTLLNAGISGISQDGLVGGVENLGKLGKNIAERKIKDALGIKYKR